MEEKKIGTTSDGDPVVSGIGYTAHSGADAVYDRDAYDAEGLGSEIHGSDVSGSKWHRMQLWQKGHDPSYQGEAAVRNSSGEQARQDKRWYTEWAAAVLGVADDVLISEAKDLAASTSGQGHCIEKVALGALINCQERSIATRAARADLSDTLEEIAEHAAEGSDRETTTALNLLDEADVLEPLFGQRLYSREDAHELADEHEFSVVRAAGIYHA